MHETQFQPIGILLTEPRAVPGREFGTLNIYFVLEVPNKTGKAMIKERYHCSGSPELMQSMLDMEVHKGDIIQVKGRVFYSWQAMVGTKHFRAKTPYPEMFLYVEQWRFMQKVKETRRQRKEPKNSLNKSTRCMPEKRIHQIQNSTKSRYRWGKIH